MNAYQLMVFLLLFNVSVSVVLGLGIYSNDLTSPGDIYVNYTTGEDDVIQDVEGNVNLSTQALESYDKADVMAMFGGNILVSLVTGAVIGGALSFLTQIPGDAAFAYSMFITFYWGMAKNTVDILFSLTEESAAIGLFYVVVIFVIILSISFLSFMLQLVRGPWASMR